MDCDSECFMDVNMLVTGQDHTRTALWIMILSIYMGKSCFYSVVKSFFVWLFACFFTFSTFQFQLWILSSFCLGLQWESSVGIVWWLDWRGLVGIMFLSRGCELLEINMALKIPSLSVNGLRQKFRQDVIFTRFDNMGFGVVFLQETHIANIIETDKFSKLWEGRKFWSLGTTRSCGVGIH